MLRSARSMKKDMEEEAAMKEAMRQRALDEGRKQRLRAGRGEAAVRSFELRIFLATVLTPRTD